MVIRFKPDNVRSLILVLFALAAAARLEMAANEPSGAGRLAALEPATESRLRVIIETDAGGDPDDEQSLVRFLLYANEWDVEGIIANRPIAREKENHNRERTGLGIVRAFLSAYRECYPRLRLHDARYPSPETLFRCTVPGYADRSDGEDLILRALESNDPRPVWFSNWGTDHGSAPSNLKRALDRILRERGADEYHRLKARLRLSSSDEFGEHTLREPYWPIWVDTFRPELDGKRWYHRFSAITARAGGFDIERDVRTGHGPLGALYPTNTTHPQKEGDTMAFLYLVPTGMNDVNRPEWGSWAGRYGLMPDLPGRLYYWANLADAWQGSTHRENTLARWAVDLQNDFRARLDWCVQDFPHGNHPPVAVVNGDASRNILVYRPQIRPTDREPTLDLNAARSIDPDGRALSFEWWLYREAGTYQGDAGRLEHADSPGAKLHIPPDLSDKELHVVLTVRDTGDPPLATYRRVIVRSSGAPAR